MLDSRLYFKFLGDSPGGRYRRAGVVRVSGRAPAGDLPSLRRGRRRERQAHLPYPQIRAQLVKGPELWYHGRMDKDGNLSRWIPRLGRGMRRLWEQGGDPLLAVGCGLLALALYLRTLAPSVAALFDDSLEFPLVAHRLAIAHPTGYPLYTLLGKLFILSTGGNVARSVNLLSAVAAALTVALLYALARSLTRRRAAALLGAMALALSPIFWSQAVVAEVYTLNTLFVVGLLGLMLRWAREPLAPVRPFALLWTAPRRAGPLFLPAAGWWLRRPPALRRAAHRLHTLYRRFFPAVPPRRRLQLHRRAYLPAALLGLALTHHRTILLSVPAMLLFVLLVEPRALSRAALLGPEHPDRPRWRQVLGRPVVLLLLSLLLPLALYLYLPLRAHVGSLDGSYAQWGFWRWVTAGGYGAFLGENPLARDLDATFYLNLFRQQFGPVGLALALTGLIALARRPKILALTGLAFLAYVAFALLYRVPDVEVFFIPAFLLTALWIAVGLDAALDRLRIWSIRRDNAHGSPPGPAVRRFPAFASVLLVVLAFAQPLLLALRNYPDRDLSRRWIVHDYGRYLLDQELPYGESTVIGLGGEMTLLEYWQDTTGLRADVETVRADDEAARRAAVEAALAAGRAVFLTRPLPGLEREQPLDAVTGVIDVLGNPETLLRVAAPEDKDPPRPTALEPMPGLRLLGYGLRPHAAHWQRWLRLRLWWQAPQVLDAPFKVSARLLDAQGRTVAAADAEPVAGAYPAVAWRPGEVVADAYEIPLPAGLPPGDYHLLVIVYDPVTTAELGRAALGAVSLQGNPARPPRRALEADLARTLYARFGPVELLGWTPPDSAMVYHPGAPLPLTLLWQAVEPWDDDLGVAFWLEAVGEFPLGQEVVGGEFPVPRWQAGQVVRQQPLLTVPTETPAGTYRLWMRVSRGDVPLPWSRGLLPGGSDLKLGTVQVER